jgi:hypothetical protein
MGSGLEVHQKRILAALEADSDVLVSDLCRTLHVGNFSSAQYNNLSATLETLSKRGLVETYVAWVPNPWHGSHRDALPAVRLMPEATQPYRWPPLEARSNANV